MADSAVGGNAPRIERLTLWAIALDVGAVVTGVFALVGFVFVAPLATVTALVISVRSARRAGRLSAKVAAWVTVLVSGALLVLWVYGMYELTHPTCISCG